MVVIRFVKDILWSMVFLLVPDMYRGEAEAMFRVVAHSVTSSNSLGEILGIVVILLSFVL